jgi:DNA polymerase III epsilon subunit-like protein
MPLQRMDHLNGHLLCGIDIETTGLDFEKHQIYELAIIPVNSDFERDSNRKWLDLKIKPSRPETIDWGGMEYVKNSKRVKNALESGLDPNTAMDILDFWFDQLGLGTKKIAPLGHNYSFESRFLRTWLGELHYESIFTDAQVRDTMSNARFMNDLCEFRTETGFDYPKCDLTYLAIVLKVEHNYGKSHSALGDAATTIDVYRKQLEKINSKMIFPTT